MNDDFKRIWKEEVLVAMIMKITGFWIVVTHGLVNNCRPFGGTFYLHSQGRG
jgi:hypothetical protein